MNLIKKCILIELKGKKRVMRAKKLERILWGLFFIVAAIILVTNKLGIFEGIGTFSIWGLLLAAVLVVCCVKSIAHYNIPGVIFSVAFICIIYAQPLGIAALSPWTILFAAVLGSIGFSIIFHKKKYNNWEKKFERHFEKQFDGQYDTIDQTIDDAVSVKTSFGSSIKYINSDNFQRADIHCSFGGMKVYFDNACIQNGQAEVYLDVSFAGVELFVPKAWTIVNDADFTLSGMDEKNRNQSNGTPVLRLTGSASFSGVTIYYV